MMVLARRSVFMLVFIVGAMALWSGDAFAQANCGERSSEWEQCQSDSDCALETGFCGLTSAFNKQFLSEVRAYHSCMEPTLNCKPGLQDDEGEKKAVCRSGKCMLLVREKKQDQ